jgi:2-C-methyl-D-erythritol 4-phosphate cytidylyltransferase/2-C-methyl-D-erythritol 2,4-cyclodiphosphate synthase
MIHAAGSSTDNAKEKGVIGGERLGVVLAAAGAGQRAGAAKQWVVLGGRSVLARSARAMADCLSVDEIVAVVPPGEEERGRAELSFLDRPFSVVAGGSSRTDSVRAGLLALHECPLVLVHDAARPFASPGLAQMVAEAAARDGAALAAVPVADTLKRAVSPDVESGARRKGAHGSAELQVAETVDRRHLWLAQTPQGFRTELLREAFEKLGPAAAATDDCLLVERMGHPVTLVPGEPGNFKITTADDLRRARAMTEAPVAMGIGYDVHPFAPGRRLVLGGVEFEGDGLAGHSDADICAHAIGDAILGAAGLGDLGRHFPDTDPRWEGVSSLLLLRQIAAMAAQGGWRIGNCDVTLAARRPRVAPRAAEMRERLAEALGVSAAQVNVKATTGEGLGFVGRAEGIAAHAVAVLYRSGS